MLQIILAKVTSIDERVQKLEKKQEEDRKEANKGIDINAYFPITSLTVLGDFLSNKDGLFKERKDAFEGYLNSVCYDEEDLDLFCAGLLKSLFSKDFICNHRFPTSE